MADQNPWKKQMQQNRPQTGTESTPPISQFPPQEKITPPWMKNKEPSTTTPATNNQPAWMKSNVSTANNDSGSTPAWMKNKQATSSTVGQLSKPEDQPQNTGPAWMQKKPAQQQPITSNVAAWKAGGAGFGGDKKKKEQEERVKKQQEQRERLEREEEERKRVEQEKEEEDERKARARMEEEDNLSRMREEKEKEKEREMPRIEEERKRSQQSRLHSQKQPKIKSGSKQQNMSRSPPSISAPIYTQYLHYLSESTNHSLEYKQKLSNQLSLLKVCHTFAHQMQQRLIQTVWESQQNPAKPIISSSKKNKIINMDQICAQVYYAFCEGQQTQQSEATSKQPAIKFDMSHVQKLQTVFHFYNHLSNVICSLQRKQPTLMTKFRVPLFSFSHYKGIAFLSEAYTEELLETQALLPFQLKEIVTDFATVQKELKEKFHYQLAKTDLVVKKMSIEQTQQHIYVIYLKNWGLKLSKHAQLPNQTSIEQFTTDYYFLTQSLGKKFPLIPQSQFEVFKKVKTQSFCQLADVLHLAQCIFIVYSSCQGEVQEKEFWELILSESQEIWNLIRCAGYNGKLYKDKRFLFRLFELYSGVEIKFETKKSKLQKLCVKESRCIKEVYDFARLQFSQMIKNFDKYLKDSRHELAEHSLSILKDVDEIKNNNKSQSLTEGENVLKIDSVNYTLQKSKYLISRQKYREASKILQQCLKQSQTLKSYSFASIPIKMELLVVYIKLKHQTKILQTFTQLLQIVEFYFSHDSLINATLYQMLASYYSLNTHSLQNSVENNVITLYEHAISIVLKFFGDQSEAMAEVYLSRAVAFLNLLNFDIFYKDIDHALKIYKSQSRKKDKIAECLFYKGRAKLLQNSSQARSQAIQLIEQSSGIYMRISHFGQAIDGYLILMEILDEKSDENMKKIEVLSNQVIQTLTHSFKSIQHLSRAISVAMTKLDPQLKGLIRDMGLKEQNIQTNEFSVEGQENFQAKNRQLYTDFQDMIKGYASFVEMVKWLGWTAISMVKTQNSNSTARQKFVLIAKLLQSIMKIIFEQREQIGQQDSEDKISVNSQSQEQSQSESSKLGKSAKSSREQYSPMGQMQNEFE